MEENSYSDEDNRDGTVMEEWLKEAESTICVIPDTGLYTYSGQDGVLKCVEVKEEFEREEEVIQSRKRKRHKRKLSQNSKNILNVNKKPFYKSNKIEKYTQDEEANKENNNECDDILSSVEEFDSDSDLENMSFNQSKFNRITNIQNFENQKELNTHQSLSTITDNIKLLREEFLTFKQKTIQMLRQRNKQINLLIEAQENFVGELLTSEASALVDTKPDLFIANLPVNSSEELNSLLEQNYNGVVNLLKCCASPTLNGTVSRMLRELMTKELAVSFSFTGVGGPMRKRCKLEFRTTKAYVAVLEAIRCIEVFKYVDVTRINKALMYVLRCACDWNGRQSKLNELKNESSSMLDESQSSRDLSTHSPQDLSPQPSQDLSPQPSQDLSTQHPQDLSAQLLQDSSQLAPQVPPRQPPQVPPRKPPQIKPRSVFPSSLSRTLKGN